MKGFGGSGKPLERAEAAAKEILNHADRLNFVELGTLGSRTIGLQKPTAEQQFDAEWPHWFDRLRWWTSRDEVGFVAIKALGGPTRAVLTVREDMNLKWFKK